MRAPRTHTQRPTTHVAQLARGPLPRIAPHEPALELAPDPAAALRLARALPEQLRPAGVLALQAGAGNRAVQGLLRRKPARPGEGGTATPAFEHRLDGLHDGGSPLPGEVRDFMEPRFGADFGAVRLHAGTEGAQLSRDLGALAFTHGRDIYMEAGDGSFKSPADKLVLAHELAHTLQPGAESRIAGWWPAGHRHVTKIAMEKSTSARIFLTEEAAKYLVDRSPDMDFMQDETNAMEIGQRHGVGVLKTYEDKAKSKKQSDKDEAQRMWEENEIHSRPPAYMLSHGEGGQYKREGNSVNRAMTNSLVAKAVAAYNPENTEQSLSILSDAIHQAADRGSHEEGTPFKGHDVRRTFNPSRTGHPAWEKETLKPGVYLGKNTDDTDNASKNQSGLALAVGFVQGVLEAYKAGVMEKEGVQTLKIGRKGEQLATRESKFNPLGKPLGRVKGTSKGLGGKFAGKTADVKKGKGKELRDILEGQKQYGIRTVKVVELIKQAREDLATQSPAEGEEAQRERQLLDEGLKFYELALNNTGAQAENKFDELKSKYTTIKKKWGRGKQEVRIDDLHKEARAYHDQETGKESDPVKKRLLHDIIDRAFLQVFRGTRREEKIFREIDWKFNP